MGALAIVVAAALLQDGAPTEPDDVEHPFLVVHVAIDGDDSWSGLKRRSDGRGGGPLRTPHAALRRLREMRTRDPTLREHSVEIALANGRWLLDAPLEIGPLDSGTRGHPLVIRGEGRSFTDLGALPNFLTVLSGGRRITGWHVAQRARRDVWVAAVPDDETTRRPWTFRELFADGARCTRARSPDRGVFAIAGLCGEDAARSWTEGVAALRVAPADVAHLVDGEPADVTLLSRWVESHCRVASLSSDRATIRLSDRTVFKPDPGDVAYVESLSALDQPGEWWLDEEARLVWFVPRPGDDPESTEIVAPRLASLVEVTGLDDPAGRVHDVQFDTLAFEHAEWWFPTPTAGAARASGFPQAAVDVPAAIRLRGAEHVRFRSCAVTHCGTYGFEFGRACRDDELTACVVRDLAGGGVKIGEKAIPTGDAETSRITVKRCWLGDLGRGFHSAVGVWIGQSPDNRVEQCVLSGLDYTGISIGWTWGYGAAHAGGNTIENNEIGFIGGRAPDESPLLSDLAAVYTLGTQDGTVVRGNYIHDVAARTYGGWGIYFDEGTTHVEAANNFVIGTTHGGFHQHYGKENRVHHNLFAFGRDAQLQRTRPEPHTSFTFDHNALVANGGELFAGDLRDGHFDFHDNVYELRDAGHARFAGRTFAEWRASGQDDRSIVTAVDLVQGAGPFRGRDDPPVWFAPTGSPLWTVVDPESVRHGALYIRDLAHLPDAK